MKPIPELPPASLRLKVDTAALAANWRALDGLSGTAQAGAAVKADAYGLGAALAVPTLRDAGARQFYVAHWGEVPALLDYVEASWISVLHGVGSPQECAFARATGIRPVINSLRQAALWLESGGGPCDLMVDTGMNRLGIAAVELGDPVLRQLQIDTLLSHLASAEENGPQNAAQLAAFKTACAVLPARRRSLANSAGIALGPRYAFDVTRPGLALYGGVPCASLEPVIRQVAFPQAAVLQVRQLSAGDPVGYNATFTAPRAMRSATVSIGYADGYLRCWSGQGTALFDGVALPVIGRVSMDMIIVDCSGAPSLAEGDWVDLDYALPQAARVSGLSQYELLTLMGQRLQRKGV